MKHDKNILIISVYFGINMPFGERIKKLRKEKGWSLKKLGENAGLQGRLIGQYESNNVAPTANSIIKLAKAFNVSTDYLLIDNNNDNTRLPSIHDNKLIELFEKLNNMNSRDKEVIISLIDAYIKKNQIENIIDDTINN